MTDVVAHPEHRPFPIAVAASIVLHLCVLGALMRGLPSGGRSLPHGGPRHALVVSLIGAGSPASSTLPQSAEPSRQKPSLRTVNSSSSATAAVYETEADHGRETGAKMPPADEPPAAEAGGGEPKQVPFADYRERLLSHLSRFRFYPPDARRAGREGVVRVRFEMTRAGAVISAKVETSSGDAALDSAAVATVFRAQPLPPIPAALPDSLAVLMPIAFSLPRTAALDASPPDPAGD